MVKEEFCCICDSPTGKSGKNEDSFYDNYGGPYCETCYMKDRP